MEKLISLDFVKNNWDFYGIISPKNEDTRPKESDI